MSLNTAFKTDKMYEKPMHDKPQEKPCTKKLHLTPSVLNMNNIKSPQVN